MLRLEQTILKSLIYNEEFTRRVLPFLKDEYFFDNTERTIFKFIQDYVNKYNSNPTHEAIIINITESRDLSEDTVTESVEILNEMYREKDDIPEIDWLIENTEKFCQDRGIHNAIRESVDILDNPKGKKSKGEIPKLLSDALSISFDNNIGHDYMSDVEERYESYHRVEKRVPFDIDILNKITRNGFPIKTLNVFMASTGVGKSLFMTHMAANNIANGKNVLYITMELSEEKVAERVDANLMNIPLGDLHKLSKNEYMSKFRYMTNKAHGKLIVKEYPTSTASTLHFRALLNELKLKKNFTPDIIYIDYLNICSSSRISMANVNSYTYIKSIAEEFRGMAVEYAIPVITVTQTNRGGYDNSDVDLTNTSESFGLPATVDFMAAIMTNDDLEKMGQVLVKQLKNRYNDLNYYKKFVIGIDRSRMKLYNLEDNAQNILDKGKTDSDSGISIGNTTNSFVSTGAGSRTSKSKFNQLKV